MSGWQVATSRRTQQQVNRLASVLAPLLEQRPRKERKPEWMCGVCGTFNFLDRANCRKCGVAHATPAAGKGGGKNGGKGGAQRPNLQATLQAAKAAGASDATVESLKQDAAQAKQDKQTLGARLDSAVAPPRKAKDQLRRCDEAVQTALRRQDEAAKALEQAEQEVAAPKEKALEQAEAKPKQTPPPAVGELLKSVKGLLATLESSWGAEDLSNAVQELNAAVARCTEPSEEVDVEHLDTDDDYDGPPKRLARRVEGRKPRSCSPTGGRVHSRTPPPTSRRSGG